MLSTEVVIGIYITVSVCFLFTGSVLAVWCLRYRDRRRQRIVSRLARGLSNYHRTHLSVDGANYAHIHRPRATLRRSGHLPYGAISESRTETPTQEILRPQQMASIEEQTETDVMVPRPKRIKSIRQTLYGHSLNVPKSRRQRRNEKAIAQSALPLSPLSAITEFRGSPGSETPEVAELPTSITPRATPEEADNAQTSGRPASIQWPLPLALHRSKDTSATRVISIPARDNILTRKASLEPAVQVERPALSRSISLATTFPSTPEDSLPSLALGTNQPDHLAEEGRFRSSNASLHTIGSSVLNSMQGSSPYKSSYNQATPTVDLSSPGLHQFSLARTEGNPTAIRMGMAAGKQQELTACKPGTNSFTATIGEHGAFQNDNACEATGHSIQRFDALQSFDGWLKTIDASSWQPHLPSRSGSHRSTLGPSLPASIGRMAYKNVSTSTRSSIFEPPISVSKRASNPVVHSLAAEILTGSPRQLAPPRPASVASGTPYQWDLRPPSVTPLQAKRGHKRQNCVRISNLPALDSKRNSKLPEMMEEEETEEERPASPKSRAKIPGLTLLEVENGIPALSARASLVDIKASPSPFSNRPVLEPTTRTRQPCQRQSSTESQGIPRPDSDIFMNLLDDPGTPDPFKYQRKKLRSNWPLSSTPRNNIKLNSTPSTLSAVEEPYEPDSPMLPSPALTNAAFFQRKSAVQGPLKSLLSAKSSRNASPSPRNGRVGQKQTGDELRRSVKMLRRLKSEGQLLDPASRLYRNMGEQSMSNFSLLNTSQSSLGPAMKSTRTTNDNFDLNDKRKGSNIFLKNANMRTSRSNMSMAFSPSTTSVSGISIWDDASVCDEADIETRNMMIHIPEHMTSDVHDPDADESFDRPRRTPSHRRDTARESKLISPQGNGLGIKVGDWGTPGSLYDGNGFLKEQ